MHSSSSDDATVEVAGSDTGVRSGVNDVMDDR
jgi:hypothetical protein